MDEDIVEDLVAARKPADVVRSAGTWLAAELAGEGLVWLRSRQDLKRKTKLRTDLIHLQSSTWNRTGEFVRVDATLSVHDRCLAAWRLAHPELTATVSPHGSDYVAGILFGTLLGAHAIGGVVLTDPSEREQRLATFADSIRTVALPWFDAVASVSDPAAIPRFTLDWSGVDLVELLVSRSELAKARGLVQHWLSFGESRPEAYQQGRELAKQGVRPGAGRRAHLLGWSSAVLGLE